MIPDSQLRAWTGLGAVEASRITYASISSALASVPIPNTQFKVYLQGSYRNGTNIRGDADVDVVAELTASFTSDRSALSASEKAYLDRLPDATYQWADFRKDVLRALVRNYGAEAVSEHNKCITVRQSSGRLPADVLVCVEHRTYRPGLKHPEGVAFFTQDDGRRIVNYPNEIYRNLVAKNDRTKNFKGAVRMFKNARNAAVDRHLIVEEDAPSYHLQNLLYNASDYTYTRGTWSDIFLEVVADLKRKLDSGTALIASNEVHPLFGSGDDRWDEGPAHRVIAGLQALWSRWS